MKYTLHAFIKLRDLIVQNDMLNTLLITTLSRLNPSEPIPVATIALPIEPETKERFEKQKKPLFSNTVLYDIIVKNTPIQVHIGIRYAGHPIIWKTSIWDDKHREASKIKAGVQKVFELYPIPNEKILPKCPEEFTSFLEAYNISFDAWQSGETLRSGTIQFFSESPTLQEYFETLEKLLTEYRIVNHLLILLLKNHKHLELTHEQETLTITPSAFNSSLLVSYRNAQTDEKKSTILYITELIPQTYSKTYKIPLELIDKFLSDLRK